jgi:hypothetical protein
MVYPSEYSEIKKYAGRWVPFCVAGVMIRKEILTRYGDNNYFFEHIGGEDLYWVGRISLKEKMANINEFLYSYRLNPNSITEQIGPVKMQIISEIINILHKEELESPNNYKILKSLDQLQFEAMNNIISKQNNMIRSLNENIERILNSTTFKIGKKIRQFLLLK